MSAYIAPSLAAKQVAAVLALCDEADENQRYWGSPTGDRRAHWLDPNRVRAAIDAALTAGEGGAEHGDTTGCPPSPAPSPSDDPRPHLTATPNPSPQHQEPTSPPLSPVDGVSGG